MHDDLERPARRDALQTLAAVDLGSNSFHMIVVRDDGEMHHVVDRLKESVRLAAGLNAARNLDEAACERALACLARFGQRLKGLPYDHVRAVGTNTLRRAQGAEGFIERASMVLGHPIEVIYGAEEARLIYGGVVQDLGAEMPRRLVVDIGGGSTEMIIGERSDPGLMESVSVGAVSHMQRFFPDGRITRKAWQAAVMDVRVTLEPIARAYRDAGWDQAIGASGSIKAVLRAAGNGQAQEITPALLEKLVKSLLKAGRVDAIDLPGVSADRQPIFPGGLAVLAGIFESLDIEGMTVSDKALREGLIADLVGRLGDHDIRESAVFAAGERYGVDREHAERVAGTAMRLLQSASQPQEPSLDTRFLRWAALLHEIGLGISHKGYHKHGEYILRNADLPGFSQTDQVLLASLVRLHRGRFREDMMSALPREWRAFARQLVLVLRLAVIVHRGRDPGDGPPARVDFDSQGLSFSCDALWLAGRPLTRADLQREVELLSRAQIALQIPNGV